MDNKQLKLYVKIGSIVAGVITVLFVVKTHPIPVIILGVEAAVYFVAEYLL